MKFKEFLLSLLDFCPCLINVCKLKYWYDSIVSIAVLFSCWVKEKRAFLSTQSYWRCLIKGLLDWPAALGHDHSAGAHQTNERDTHTHPHTVLPSCHCWLSPMMHPISWFCDQLCRFCLIWSSFESKHRYILFMQEHIKISCELYSIPFIEQVHFSWIRWVIHSITKNIFFFF